ncbi:hypothetical protein CF327_g7459 [Tilletia walkeri]|nr:hypothetical protein CF327_g7459 [Tilletia walkeri]
MRQMQSPATSMPPPMSSSSQALGVRAGEPQNLSQDHLDIMTALGTNLPTKEGRMIRASGGVPRLRVLRPPLLRQISSAGRKTPRLERGADGGGRRTASVR